MGTCAGNSARRQIEAQTARRFTTPELFAASDPQMRGAIDPARYLISPRDRGAFAGYFCFVQIQGCARLR